MADKGYRFRAFEPGDEDGVLALWETAFKSRMAVARFKWKYLENPYDETMMLCVTDTGKIVTFYGGIPYRFRYREGVSHAVQLMDIMSHPDHREGKVFIGTAKHFMSEFCISEGLMMMYGFPGAVHYAIGEPRLNYRKAPDAAYLRVELKNRASKGMTDMAALRMEPVRSLMADDPKWAAFCAKVGRDYPFSLIRDAAFIKWRFFGHPEKQYEVMRFVRRDSGEMAGYAVLLVRQEKATLVDMLAGNSRTDVHEIFSLLGAYLGTRGSEILETWLPENHFLTQYALAAGFERLKEPLGIVPAVSLFDHSPPLEWVKDNLFYTMGEADLF